MGRYQCQACFREFARSDSLRRHKSSGVCKGTATMSDSEQSNISESSDIQTENKHMQGMKGHDIFGKYNYTKPARDSDTEMETDSDTPGDEEMGKIKTRKTHKKSPWDRLLRRTYEAVQDQFDEMVENTLREEPNVDIEEAEEMAFEELKPTYRSCFISKYQDLVRLGSALRKDPIHKKVLSTAHKLKEDEDYDDEEAMQYAVKKRRYLLERKLDQYQRPTVTVEEERQHTLIPVRSQTLQLKTNMSKK